jgi:hypothetical protein
MLKHFEEFPITSKERMKRIPQKSRKQRREDLATRWRTVDPRNKNVSKVISTNWKLVI